MQSGDNAQHPGLELVNVIIGRSKGDLPHTPTRTREWKTMGRKASRFTEGLLLTLDNYIERLYYTCVGIKISWT